MIRLLTVSFITLFHWFLYFGASSKVMEEEATEEEVIEEEEIVGGLGP